MRRPEGFVDKSGTTVAVKFEGDENAALWRVVGERIAAGERCTASAILREALAALPEYKRALVAVSGVVAPPRK